MKRGLASKLLFTLSLLALIALGAWWTVYIVRSIEFERQARVDQLRSAVQAAALKAGHLQEAPPFGPPADFPCLFEWVPTSDCEAGDISAVALPWHPELSARVQSAAMEMLEQKTLRRRVMVVGEGSLLFLLLGVCTVMLYSLFRQERRNVSRMETFVSAVTHEMKTPLAGIKSLLQTLAAGRVPAEQVARLLAMGLKETERLEHSIENVLVSGSLRTDRYQLQVERITLRTLLEAIVTHRQTVLVDRPDALSLDWRIEELGLTIQADPRALRVILENLIDNALKYGGDRSPIVLGVSRQAGRVQISVRDQGIGFDPTLAEDLFVPFHRGLDRQDEVQHGTGLGLSIARALARRMGGDLTASSPGPGSGSTFTVTLDDPEREVSG